LCGHHYRISRRPLADAGAFVLYLRGRVDAAEATLLEGRREHRAEVIGL
jgi:hypothetical protein